MRYYIGCYICTVFIISLLGSYLFGCLYLANIRSLFIIPYFIFITPLVYILGIAAIDRVVDWS